MAGWIDRDALNQADSDSFMNEAGSIINRVTSAGQQAAETATSSLPDFGALAKNLTSIWDDPADQQQPQTPSAPAVGPDASQNPLTAPWNPPATAMPTNPSQASPYSFSYGSGPAAPDASQIANAGGRASRFASQIAQVAQEEGVPADVLAGLIDTEDSGETSVSPAGARGIMQVVPGQGYDLPGEDASDPLTSIRQGARAIKDKYKQTGSWDTAGGAYFGYGTDAGGMTTGGYQDRYNQNRSKYQGQAPTNPASQTVATQAQPVQQPQATSFEEPSQAALDDPDKWSECGPVAAVIAAMNHGKDWTVAQAKKIAQDNNLWDPETGMHGLASTVQLLSQMGIDASTGDASEQHLAADAQSGNTPIISTNKHYFILKGYDPSTGQFDTSSTGTVFRGGSRWMTLDEIAHLGGGIQGAAYIDNPSSATPSVRASQGAPAAMPEGGQNPATSGQKNAGDNLPPSQQTTQGQTARDNRLTAPWESAPVDDSGPMLRQPLSQPTMGPDTAATTPASNDTSAGAFQDDQTDSGRYAPSGGGPSDADAYGSGPVQGPGQMNYGLPLNQQQQEPTPGQRIINGITSTLRGAGETGQRVAGAIDSAVHTGTFDPRSVLGTVMSAPFDIYARARQEMIPDEEAVRTQGTDPLVGFRQLGTALIGHDVLPSAETVNPEGRPAGDVAGGLLASAGTGEAQAFGDPIAAAGFMAAGGIIRRLPGVGRFLVGRLTGFIEGQQKLDGLQVLDNGALRPATRADLRAAYEGNTSTTPGLVPANGVTAAAEAEARNAHSVIQDLVGSGQISQDDAQRLAAAAARSYLDTASQDLVAASRDASLPEDQRGAALQQSIMARRARSAWDSRLQDLGAPSLHAPGAGADVAPDSVYAGDQGGGVQDPQLRGAPRGWQRATVGGAEDVSPEQQGMAIPDNGPARPTFKAAPNPAGSGHVVIRTDPNGQPSILSRHASAAEAAQRAAFETTQAQYKPVDRGAHGGELPPKEMAPDDLLNGYQQQAAGEAAKQPGPGLFDETPHGAPEKSTAGHQWDAVVAQRQQENYRDTYSAGLMPTILDGLADRLTAGEIAKRLDAVLRGRGVHMDMAELAAGVRDVRQLIGLQNYNGLAGSTGFIPLEQGQRDAYDHWIQAYRSGQWVAPRPGEAMPPIAAVPRIEQARQPVMESNGSTSLPNTQAAQSASTQGGGARISVPTGRLIGDIDREARARHDAATAHLSDDELARTRWKGYSDQELAQQLQANQGTLDAGFVKGAERRALRGEIEALKTEQAARAPKASEAAQSAATPQWRYEDYTPFQRQLAKTYTRSELEQRLGKADGARGKLSASHLAAVEATTSNLSQSQRRAQSRNAMVGNYENAQNYRNALEIHDQYPEHAKQPAQVTLADGRVPEGTRATYITNSGMLNEVRVMGTHPNGSVQVTWERSGKSMNVHPDRVYADRDQAIKSNVAIAKGEQAAPPRTETPPKPANDQAARTAKTLREDRQDRGMPPSLPTETSQPESSQPAPEAETQPVRTLEGPTGKKTFALGIYDRTKKYPLQWRAVPLDSLIASHSHTSLAPNPDFPQEFQPRARETAATRQWLETESQPERFSPDSLLTDTHELGGSAPIVGPEGLVESGNGRVMLLRHTRDTRPDTYAKYREALPAAAHAVGISSRDLAGIKDPVLVRENLTPFEEGQRGEFTKEANTDDKLELTAGERARSDARLVDAEDLAALQVPADGDIRKAVDSAANREWVRKIIDRLPPSERGGMIQGKKGELSEKGAQRIRNAIFARVFGGEAGLQIQANYMDAATPEEKAIGHAISGALVDLAKLEGAVADGQTDSGLAIAEPLAEAVLLRTEAKETRQKLSELVASRQALPGMGDPADEITQALALWIDKNVKRPAVLRETLQEYARTALREPPPGQGSMFDGAGSRSAVEVWDEAANAVRENKGLAPTWRGSAPAEQQPAAETPSRPQQTAAARPKKAPAARTAKPAAPEVAAENPTPPTENTAAQPSAPSAEPEAPIARKNPSNSESAPNLTASPPSEAASSIPNESAINTQSEAINQVNGAPPAEPPKPPAPPSEPPGAGGIEPPSDEGPRDVHTVGAGYWSTTMPDEAVKRFQKMLDEWAQYSRSGGVKQGEVFEMARALGVDPAWLAKTVERALNTDTKMPAVESEALKLAALRAFADVETLQSQLRDLQSERGRRGDPDGVLAADVATLEQSLKAAQSTLELVGKAERRDVEGHARALAQQQFRVAAGAGAEIVNRLTANVDELAKLAKMLKEIAGKDTLTEEDLGVLRHLERLLDESGVLLGGHDDQVGRILQAIKKALGEQGKKPRAPSKSQRRVIAGKSEDLAKEIKRQSRQIGEGKGKPSPLTDLAEELVRTNRAQAHLRDQNDIEGADQLEPARQDLLARMNDLLRDQILKQMQKSKPAATMLDVDRTLARGILASIRRSIEEQMRFPQHDLDVLQAKMGREMQRALDRDAINAVLDQLRQLNALGRNSLRAADIKQGLDDMQPALEALGAAGRARADALREGLFKASLMRGTTDDERFLKLQAAQALVDPSNGAQVGAFLKILREPGWIDHAQEAMVVNMLTSPQTWFLTGVNATSNALQIGGRALIMVPLAHGVGEARWLNAGMAAAAPEALARAREIMAQGYLTDDAERAMMTGDWAQTRPELMGQVPHLGVAYRGKTLGKVGMGDRSLSIVIPGLYHISTRPLNAMDVAQGHMLYAGTVAQLAYRKAGELLAAKPKGVRVPSGFGPEEVVYRATPEGTSGYIAKARSTLITDRNELTQHILRNLHQSEYSGIKDEAGDIEDYYLLRKPLTRKGDESAEGRIDRAFQRFVSLRHAERGASLGVKTAAMTAHLMLPFFNSSYNATKQMLSLSPPGIVYNAYRAATAKSKYDRREALVKMVAGVGLMALAYYLQSQDLLTGDGPDDAGEYARWRRTHEPHSLFVAGKWRRLDNTIIGMPLIATANAIEDAKAAMAKTGRKPDEQLGDAALAFGGGLIKGTAAAILGQSSLRALSDTGNLFQGKTSAAAMGANYVTRIFPATSLLRWAAQMGDPLTRDPKSFSDFIDASLPGAPRASVQTKLNEWGEPIANPRYGLAASLDPFRSVRPWGLDDPIIKKLDESSVTLPTAPGTVRNVPLTDDERRAFTLEAGPLMKEQLRSFVLDPGFSQMPMEMRQKAVDAIVGPIRKNVGDGILQQMGVEEMERRLNEQTKTPLPNPERKAS